VTLQQREHPRYAHEAAVTLRTADAADDRTISGRTVNLSHGGLCATLSAPLAVGLSVEADVQLVFEDDRQSEPLRLRGRIVWCTAVNDGHQVGVRFQGLEREKAEDLTMFLRYLDDGGINKAEKPPTPRLPIDERFG
jgi:c-di-GMP-binding flagellar brake protein YcgR